MTVLHEEIIAKHQPKRLQISTVSRESKNMLKGNNEEHRQNRQAQPFNIQQLNSQVSSIDQQLEQAKPDVQSDGLKEKKILAIEQEEKKSSQEETNKEIDRLKKLNPTALFAQLELSNTNFSGK